jgi:hypothetical protein
MDEGLDDLASSMNEETYDDDNGEPPTPKKRRRLWFFGVPSRNSTNESDENL